MHVWRVSSFAGYDILTQDQTGKPDYLNLGLSNCQTGV